MVCHAGDTGRRRDGQRRHPPGPAGAGSLPSDQGKLKNQRPVMAGSSKGPGCLGLKSFLGCRTSIAKPGSVPGKLAPLSVHVVCRCVEWSAAWDSGKPFSRGLLRHSSAEACCPWPSCPCDTVSLHFLPSASSPLRVPGELPDGPTALLAEENGMRIRKSM